MKEEEVQEVQERRQEGEEDWRRRRRRTNYLVCFVCLRNWKTYQLKKKTINWYSKYSNQSEAVLILASD